MSVCVGPRLLLIAVASVVAVASHHLIARGAEGVALVPVRPLVAVDQDAADAVQRLQVLDHAVQLPAVGVLVARLVVAVGVVVPCRGLAGLRSEEHTPELQSLMRISYAVFCLKKKQTINEH